MRSRLMEAALLVFGQPAAEPAAIDHVIRKAGVSRGSFYNYFDSAEDLLKTTAIEAGNEIMRAVAPIVDAEEEPECRMAAGIRSWITLVERHPHLSAFFRRAGLYILEQNTQIRTDMPRDLAMGMESGRFSIVDMELGFVLVAGTVLAAINTLALGDPPPNYGSKLAQRVLMSLGVEAADAEAVAFKSISIATLPPTSIIVRAGQ